MEDLNSKPGFSPGKLLRGFSNLAFLLRPQLKFGALMYTLDAVRQAVLDPIAQVAEVTVAQAVITAVQQGKTFAEILIVALGRLAVCYAATLIGWIGVDFYYRWKSVAVNSEVERMIYDHALKIDIKHMDDPKFYDAYKLATEEFVAKSSETISNVTWFLGNLVTIGAMTAILASISPLLIILVVGTTLINFATQIYWNKQSAERSKSGVKPRRRADYLRRLLFNTAAAGDLRSTRVTAPLMNAYGRSIDDRVNIMKKYMKKEFLVDIFQSVLGYSSTFIIVIYVAWGLLNGRIADIGVFATMLGAAQALSGRLSNLSWMLSNLNQAAVYAGQVRTFFDIKPVLEIAAGQEAPDGTLSVALRGVNFCYPNSKFCLKDINISAAAGEHIAIVGENGAGKSTLAKLLLRLYEAHSGDILLNGKPIQSYDVHSLRDRVGISFQATNVYALTLRENLQIYRHADDKRLKEILEAVGLGRKFAEKETPQEETADGACNPLDTELTCEFEEKGILLSGGEAQKLGLARLLAGDFGLILLDEPSSALDPIAEYEMTKLMFSRVNATTTIMIAHRLSTVRDADRIYLIADGAVAEVGTHDELMHLGGKYAEMFTKQAENYISGFNHTAEPAHP
jgi:ATP-binding cassette subfamily B protein